MATESIIEGPARPDARLHARPCTSGDVGEGGGGGVGLHPLRLGAGRDGLLFVPASYRPDRPAPLVVMLHGAGGDGRGALQTVETLAESGGVIVLAPDSRAPTWDVIASELGPDVDYLDRALGRVFAEYTIDPDRVAVAGFSDGASYALTLGLANGELFRVILAFSPGFAAPPSRQGSPRVFVSHGTKDRVLPIAQTSRQLVPRLRLAGLDVEYREFPGGHAIPDSIRRAAMEWVSGRGEAPW